MGLGLKKHFFTFFLKKIMKQKITIFKNNKMNIDKNTAKRLYPESPDWFKEQLEKEFGADYLQPSCYENIKTFDDAYYKLGINPDSLFKKSDTPDEIAYKKLKIIVRAINTSASGITWEPDFTNTDQKKWYPWFNLSSGSGFGFSCSAFYYDNTHTDVGARLCFQTKEQSDYAATQFIDIYKQFLTIKK
jgi:hypothetical protein